MSESSRNWKWKSPLYWSKIFNLTRESHTSSSSPPHHSRVLFMNLILCNQNNSRVKQLRESFVVSVDELLQQVSLTITCNSQIFEWFSEKLFMEKWGVGVEWKCRKCKIRIREINSASVYYAYMQNFNNFRIRKSKSHSSNPPPPLLTPHTTN